jgi:hypothetical protein
VCICIQLKTAGCLARQEGAQTRTSGCSQLFQGRLERNDITRTTYLSDKMNPQTFGEGPRLFVRGATSSKIRSLCCVVQPVGPLQRVILHSNPRLRRYSSYLLNIPTVPAATVAQALLGCNCSMQRTLSCCCCCPSAGRADIHLLLLFMPSVQPSSHAGS